MPPRKKRLDPEKRARIIAEARQAAAKRQDGYRERAMVLFPHVCARCGREFAGKDLRELTVHHKDHDHNNNPPDGSNWELLCLYCHDDEHQKAQKQGAYEGAPPSAGAESSLGFNPFEGLGGLIKPEGDGQD